MQESSTKPYLIRALHEWCTDNGYTPHIVVTVDANTVVPAAHIRDGQITLNIGTLATNQLRLGNDYIEFQTRFGGVTETIFVPVAAVSAIYARETGAGMGFEVESSKPYPGTESSGSAPAAGPRVVADNTQGDNTATAGPSSPDDDPKPPRLKVVK
ncbi:MAG: ClpXP protease specificity-enhancing factor [Burkholderiaceae bacterium]|jgi:stringent starvation protein B